MKSGTLNCFSNLVPLFIYCVFETPAFRCNDPYAESLQIWEKSVFKKVQKTYCINKNTGIY